MLPNEIWYIIFHFLSRKEQEVVSWTCRDFQALVSWIWGKELRNQTEDVLSSWCRQGALVPLHRTLALRAWTWDSIRYPRLLLHQAVRSGKVPLVEWIQREGKKHGIEKDMDWTKCSFIYACETGGVTMMEWMLKQSCPWGRSAFEHVLEQKNPLSALKLLFSYACPCLRQGRCHQGVHWNELTFTGLISTRNREIVCWALRCHIPAFVVEHLHRMMDLFSEWEMLSLFSAWSRNGYEKHVSTIRRAISKEHFSWWNLLYQLEWPWTDPDLFVFAISQGGRISKEHLLEWLYAHHVSWDFRCYEAAAQNYRVDILDWLKSHGCPGSPTLQGNTWASPIPSVRAWFEKHPEVWNFEILEKEKNQSLRKTNG